MKKILISIAAIFCISLLTFEILTGQRSATKKAIYLPSSKLLMNSPPGDPQATNSFPSAMAVSPDGRYIAVMNAGWGTKESDYRESIAIVDTNSKTSGGVSLQDFPDERLKNRARQTYFYGIAFSSDGHKLYAGIGSITDPDAKQPGSAGNGIAVYGFTDGKLTPENFIKVPSGKLPAGKTTHLNDRDAPGRMIPFPAELVVVPHSGSSAGDLLLMASNLSDEALLLDPQNGNVVRRFDLSLYSTIPGTFPYGVIVTKDGSTAYVSLWNSSRVAELDLANGKVRRMIAVRMPKEAHAAGSHPTAMLFSPDESKLYVALANTDEVAIIDRTRPTAVRFRGSPPAVLYLSTRLPGQQYGGTYPIGLAQSADGKMLFVATASADAVAVFDLTSKQNTAMGFVPTEWYPTALRVIGDNLFVLSGKGKGTGPNNLPAPQGSAGERGKYTYIGALLYGSVARMPVSELKTNLSNYTDEVLASNLMRGNTGEIKFKTGGNPIKHVIYVIKENRTYDQVFGDLGVGDGDPTLTMFGEDVTPNQHKLARQFGVVDNFYDSGEVSGDGHVWSTAAITSDYTEKTWQIAYRSHERGYDYEGNVAHAIPLEEGIPDVNEPGTGYLWTNFARHNITYRHYGEFVETRWCNMPADWEMPTAGTPVEKGDQCPKTAVQKGEPLPDHLGQPQGSPSPWPWGVPIVARNIATKPELRDHFDPRYPDFRLDFPDQLRADEFLNEFSQFVEAKKSGRGAQLPQFVLLRVGNDHTSGKTPLRATPAAAVADNDLALGRVVDAISHSPYWDDTAILVLEDDAQNGTDHVDAHRSIALVISKYSPRSSENSPDKPFVDHTFYTTVNMVHTIEALLGVPPMNNNDARAALMAPLFSGNGDQPAFSADDRNLKSGLVYEMNPKRGEGAAMSATMNFNRADAIDVDKLNAILWKDRMGDRPMPKAQHKVFGR